MPEPNEPKTQNSILIPAELISQRIFLIRGQKVMIDTDLAELYVVTTKRLREQIRRNLNRFPPDFMFQLTPHEKGEVAANCGHLESIKFSKQLPYAFTEHGALMLASVLKSGAAVEMSIFIVRAFIKLRETLYSNKELAHRVEEIEREQKLQNEHINKIYRIIRGLINEPEPKKERIGFRRDA